MHAMDAEIWTLFGALGLLFLYLGYQVSRLSFRLESLEDTVRGTMLDPARAKQIDEIEHQARMANANIKDVADNILRERVH